MSDYITKGGNMTIDERLDPERLAQIYGVSVWAVRAALQPDRTDAPDRKWHDEAVRLGVNPDLYIQHRKANER